jgi:GNAT superfamily N-acetyltransferase
VIQDPAAELVDLVRRAGDDPSPADRQAAALVRRRFGLSLAVPFVAVPRPGDAVPVRKANAYDGPAIAAVKWRSWRVAYRGILPDWFLDDLAVVPPVGHWIGLGTLAPSRRHALYVAGARGAVFGVTELRPTRDSDLDSTATCEIDVLYLEPLVRRRGIGRDLLDAAVHHARRAGTEDVRLWVVEANASARAFYDAIGWSPDGARQWVDLGGGVGMDEVRYRAPRRR